MNVSRQGTARSSTLLAVAATLAATALLVRRSARKAEVRHPPLGRFIEVDGVRLHYLEAGQGQAVLLLHGNGARADDFEGCGLIAALSPRYRVIAFDRPGFGHSERPSGRPWSPADQAALLAKACVALGAAEPVVLAHSLGTQVALEMALGASDKESAAGGTALPGDERPHFRPRGLVLVSGYYFPSFRLDSWIAATPALPVIGGLLRNTFSPLLSRLFLPLLQRQLFSPRAVPASFRQAVPKGLMLRPWQLLAAAQDSASMIPEARRVEERYGQLALPVEIFAGEGDRVVRKGGQAPRLQGKIRHSTLHRIAGEGHMLHYGISGLLSEAVDRVAMASR